MISKGKEIGATGWSVAKIPTKWLLFERSLFCGQCAHGCSLIVDWEEIIEEDGKGAIRPIYSSLAEWTRSELSSRTYRWRKVHFEDFQSQQRLVSSGNAKLVDWIGEEWNESDSNIGWRSSRYSLDGDIQNAPMIIRKYKDRIVDLTRRQMIEIILQEWLDQVSPSLSSLRIAREILGDYQTISPSENLELQVLSKFIRMRSAMSVTISNYHQSLQPDNACLQIREKPAWPLLESFVDE
jgi:hypothetical protein